MADITDYHNGIAAIDADYVAPKIVAIHLLVHRGRAAIIDTGTNHSVARVMEALGRFGIAPEQVSMVILTHIHLDHAGGCGELMQRLPNAQLLVHPRGARHMVNPERLTKGTIAVYGKKKAASLYGALRPVESSRVHETAHEERVSLHGRELLLLHTPGHALHHQCILDLHTGHLFSGDTFGLSYRQLDRGDRQFIMATTTPVHFDPVALHQSVDLLAACRPEAIYLTHYSQITNIPRMHLELKASIDAQVEIAQCARGVGPARVKEINRGLTQWITGLSKAQGWGLQGDAAANWLAMDIELNAQGLNHWLERSEGGEQ